MWGEISKPCSWVVSVPVIKLWMLCLTHPFTLGFVMLRLELRTTFPRLPSAVRPLHQGALREPGGQEEEGTCSSSQFPGPVSIPRAVLLNPTAAADPSLQLSHHRQKQPHLALWDTSGSQQCASPKDGASRTRDPSSKPLSLIVPSSFLCTPNPVTGRSCCSCYLCNTLMVTFCIFSSLIPFIQF